MVAAPASEQRRDARSRCRIRATAVHNGHRSPATVLDLSMGGISIYLRVDIGIVMGATVTVETDEIGSLSGTVRWIREPRVGLEVGRSSNTAAKISSYLRSRD